MIFNLHFVTKSKRRSEAELRAWLDAQPNTTTKGAEVRYSSLDTGVMFGFTLGERPELFGRTRAPVSLELPYLRPLAVGLEAAEIVERLVRTFELDVAEPTGPGAAAFTKGGFVASWKRGSRAAHRARGETPEGRLAPALLSFVLEGAWRWSYQRKELETWLRKTHSSIFVPKVSAVEDPAHPGITATSVVWSGGGSIALPDVDIVNFIGSEGPSWIASKDLEPLLADFPAHAHRDTFEDGGVARPYGMRHRVLGYASAPPELLKAVVAAATKGTPKIVKWPDVGVAEWLAEGVLLPALEQLADRTKIAEFEMHWLSESAHRATVITIAGAGMVRRGPHNTKLAERTLVGFATTDEVARVADAISSSGFPDIDMPTGRPPPPPSTPPVQCSVTLGRHRAAVDMPASQLAHVPTFDWIREAFVAVVDAIEKRDAKTVSPDNPEAKPPSKAPPEGPSGRGSKAPADRPSAAPAATRSPLYSMFVDVVSGRIPWPVVFRRLAEYRQFCAPADIVAGASVPRVVEERGVRTALFFTAEPPLSAWIDGGGKAEAFARGLLGMNVFGDLQRDVSAVDLDISSPVPLRLRGDAVRALRRVARGVQAVHALANLRDRSIARHALRYDRYRILFQQQKGVAKAMTIVDAQRHPFAVVVSSDLALEAFLNAWPHLRSTVVLGANMDGPALFRDAPGLGATGIVVDPHTPLLAAVPNEVCTRLLGEEIALHFVRGRESEKDGKFWLTVHASGDVTLDRTMGGATQRWEGRIPASSVAVVLGLLRDAAFKPFDPPKTIPPGAIAVRVEHGDDTLDLEREKAGPYEGLCARAESIAAELAGGHLGPLSVTAPLVTDRRTVKP